MNFNIFRISGDLSHTLSKCILIWSIHTNRSAEGVSLITQVLYTVVFSTRYIDIFWTPPWYSYWNFVLKIFYTASSLYIVFLMMRVFARTREREKAWRLGAYSSSGSLVAAPVSCPVFEGWSGFRFFEILYVFSLVLESVCILPQSLLLRQTTVPTVIDSFYLVTLGSYRFFYISNWIVRGITGRGRLEAVFPISVICGVVQTGLYIDFAWVYFMRQRVKLRGGGVVDGEDLSKGWLISRIIGRRSIDVHDEDDEREGLASAEEGGGIGRPAAARHGSGWGPRGISVSADDTSPEAQHDGAAKGKGMTDPERFEDDIEEDDIETPKTQSPTEDAAAGSGVSNGAEWRDDDRK